VKRLLVTGAGGLLGSHLVRLARGTFHVLGLHSPRSRTANVAKVDLGDLPLLEQTVREFAPHVVIHAGAMTTPVECEEKPDLATRVNVDATRRLAALVRELDARLLLLSTDLVFDGEKGMYCEEDAVGPLSHYARTKVEAERATLDLAPNSLIVRVTLMVGTSPNGGRSVNEVMQRALERGETIRLFTDEFRALIGVENLAEALLELAEEYETGILHLCGPERRSRHEWGMLIARHFGWDLSRIQPVTRAEMKLFPPRPPDVSLDISKARRILKTRIQTIEEVLRDLGR